MPRAACRDEFVFMMGAQLAMPGVTIQCHIQIEGIDAGFADDPERVVSVVCAISYPTGGCVDAASAGYTGPLRVGADK